MRRTQTTHLPIKSLSLKIKLEYYLGNKCSLEKNVKQSRNVPTRPTGVAVRIKWTSFVTDSPTSSSALTVRLCREGATRRFRLGLLLPYLALKKVLVFFMLDKPKTFSLKIQLEYFLGCDVHSKKSRS